MIWCILDHGQRHLVDFWEKFPMYLDFIWIEQISYNSGVLFQIVWSRTSIFKLKSFSTEGCKSCLFFGAFSLILLISIWCKPSFEIQFDQSRQVTMLFWCGGGSHPPCTWQGFQTSHLLGLNEKNSTAKIWQIFWQNFLQKLVFLNFYFFTFLYIFPVPDKISELAVPHFLQTNVRDLLNLSLFW